MEQDNDEKREKLKVMQSVALQQAMREFCDENRAEIVKRARMKLEAIGVKFKDEVDENGSTLS